MDTIKNGIGQISLPAFHPHRRNARVPILRLMDILQCIDKKCISLANLHMS